MSDQYSDAIGWPRQNVAVIDTFEASLMPGSEIDGGFSPQDTRYRNSGHNQLEL
jgi:hypothetical protein